MIGPRGDFAVIVVQVDGDGEAVKPVVEAAKNLKP